MITINQRRSLAALCAGAVLAAACGGSGGSDSAKATDPAPVTTTKTAATTEPPSQMGGLDVVAAATVQIVAQGTFVDPEFGSTEGSGSGTGFVIDDSGLAVTNNHVVAGAGLLKVYVPGENEPRNAKILGVSECSDLAVIDIDGDGFTSLDWYGGDLQPGLDVYAAGYPLGDPEYTLTRGIVAKVAANGETQWASVDNVLEHDASIQPGNSGGPLVTADGEVVGINYAGGSMTNTDQFFAINAANAQSIISSLSNNEDVESLGINGQAVVSDDGSVYGLWVAGVTSGSPADELGLEPGDIVTRLEGVTIGADGTMADYCDVLRSHDSSDALSVEVLRYSSQEVLSGAFNGTPLETAFSFAAELDDTSTAESSTTYDYVQVSDDSGLLSVSVPSAWSDVDGSSIEIDGVAAPSIQASPNLDDYNGTWGTPGMYFIASAALAGGDANQLLDALTATDCTSTGREEYSDAVFSGLFEAFENCGGTDTQLINIVAFPANGAYAVVVSIQVVTDADLDAIDIILRTFNTTEG